MSRINYETSVRGKGGKVAALDWNGKAVVVNGKWVKLAFIHDEEWLDSELDNPESCIGELKKQQGHTLKADVFTFSQKLPACTPKYKYTLEWDSIAAIPLSDFAKWWEELAQETRKNSRRASKRGVTVKVLPLDDGLIRGIVGVNNESAIRQGRPFAHYGKTFEQVKEDQLSFIERSEFICAYVADELIGFIKVVHMGKVSAILQLLVKSSHHEMRPANALLVKTVEHCSQRGQSHLIYGRYRYGNKRKSSLLEFKIRHGFEEVLVPRYYVPLTKTGQLAMMLRLHRGLLGILPEWAISVGVKVRSGWYKFRALFRRCSSMLERPNRIRQTECSIPPAGSSSHSRRENP